MQITKKIPFLSLSLILLFCLGWLFVAHRFQLGIFQSQSSSLLLQVAAANGMSLEQGQYWRLVTSQFLHVHFAHMLFNLACIFLLASIIERGFGRFVLLVAYLLGGTVGQFFSVICAPDLVSSGASQALMALCGFCLFSYRNQLMPRYAIKFAAAIIGIQFMLDMYVSRAIKPGHSAAFIAGILIALGLVGSIHLSCRRISKQRLAPASAHID